MTPRLAASLAVASCLLAFALAPPPATACSCQQVGIAPPSPCRHFDLFDAVFVGRVVGFEEVPVHPDRWDEPSRLYRFEVEEAFSGVSGSEEVVRGGVGGGECGYPFEVGSRYLVYARRSSPGARLSSGKCGPTVPIGRAGDDLAYARRRIAGEPVPALVGVVVRESASRWRSEPEHEPLAGVTVRVAGAGGESWTATTDAEGAFEVVGRLAGGYTVTAELPEGTPPAALVTVEVATGRCAVAEVIATELGTVRGIVFPGPGGTLSRVDVALVDPADPALPVLDAAAVDALGVFTLRWVPPGRYLAVVNPEGTPAPWEAPYPRTFYPGTSEPGAAEVVTVGPGERVEIGPIELPPPLVATRLEGVVRWPGGEPAAGATVRLELPGRDLRGLTAETGADGRFSFPVFEGCRYGLRAVIEEGLARFVGALDPVTTGAGEGPVEIGLRPEDLPEERPQVP